MRLPLRPAGVACACAIALCAAPALPATTSVYKCPLSDGSVLYTDTPCRGGSELALQPGDADPEAIARLTHMQQQASERYARERAMATARDAESRMRESPAASYVSPPADAVGGYDYWGAPMYLTPAEPSRRPHRPSGRTRPQTVVPVR